MAQVGTTRADPVLDAKLCLAEMYADWAALGFYQRLRLNRALRRATGLEMDGWMRSAAQGTLDPRSLEQLSDFLAQGEGGAATDERLESQRMRLARAAATLRISRLSGSLRPWTSARK